MTEISGYVEIPSRNLKLACKNYLDNRQANIDARREELIQEEMSRKGWFGRPKVKTREEAIANLKVGHYGSPWRQIAIRGSYWADKVEELQDSSCLAPSVLVNVNMASFLKRYFVDGHITK